MTTTPVVLLRDTQFAVAIKSQTVPIVPMSSVHPVGPKGDPGGNIMAIGLWEDAPSLTIPSGTDLVRTSGWSDIGKGGAFYMADLAVDAAYVTANPRTSFMSANSRGFRLAPDQLITAEMFGTVGDGTSDDYAALQAMLDHGGTMYIPAGLYRITARLLVRRFCLIRGAGWGWDARLANYQSMPGTRIFADAGVSGIYFMNQAVIDDTDTVVANTPLYFVQEGSLWSEMSDVAFVGQGGAAATGVYVRAAVHLRNVHAVKFSGKGFDLSASSDVTDLSSEYGNDDTAVLDYCRAAENGSHGFHLRGRDVNVVKLDTCNAIQNGGWGFLDNAVSANLYLNCHCASNAGGGYKATGLVAAHTYVNCYLEGSVDPTCDISDPHNIIGGNLAGSCASITSSVNLHSLGPQPNISASPISVSHQTIWDWTWASPGAISGYCLTYRNGTSGLTHQGEGSSADHTLLNKNGGTIANVATGTQNWNVVGDYYRNGTKVVGAQGATIADFSHASAAPTMTDFNNLVDAFNTLLARLRASTGHGLIA